MAQTQLGELKKLDNQEYMDWLFHTFHPLMWHTAKKYCRKETLWEEIIQESLVRLLACVPRLRSLPEEKLAGYILDFSHDPQHHLYLSEKGGKGARTIHLFELCRSTGRCAHDRGKNDPSGKCGSSGQSMGRSAGGYAVYIVRLLLTGL